MNNWAQAINLQIKSNQSYTTYTDFFCVCIFQLEEAAQYEPQLPHPVIFVIGTAARKLVHIFSSRRTASARIWSNIQQEEPIVRMDYKVYFVTHGSR